MKRSALLISLSALAHLCVIDISFFMLREGLSFEDVSLNSLVLLCYNAIWLLIAVSIYNHSYNESHS